LKAVVAAVAVCEDETFFIRRCNIQKSLKSICRRETQSQTLSAFFSRDRWAPYLPQIGREMLFVSWLVRKHWLIGLPLYLPNILTALFFAANISAILFESYW
jgi:hypothetical protein